METKSFMAGANRLLGVFSLACAAVSAAHAAIPATPLVTEIFVNKNGVLGLAWNPVANAAAVRVQVQTDATSAFCKLDTTKPAGCFVNQAVTLNGPLAPTLNTGIFVAAYNSGNVFVRLVAVDSTGKNWRSTGWIAAPRYMGMTSGGSAWPLSLVTSGQPVTVTAAMANGTSMTSLWVFDIQGNSPNKSRTGMNFTVTPGTIGSRQTWVLKSRAATPTTNGLVIDTGVVNVVAPPCGGAGYMDLPYVGRFKVSQGNNGITSHRVLEVSAENTYAIDFALPSGTPLRSPVNGTIIGAKNYVSPSGGGAGGGGRVLVIQDSATGKKIVLMHLKSIVKTSGSVKKGDVVAQSGQSGCTKKEGCSETRFAPHLHMHLWNGVGSWDSHTETFPSGFRIRLKNDAGAEQCLYGADLNDNKIVGKYWTSYLQ
jgi:murein DD-endopeptidase MepM/ murein hydrolase activator NlpD